MLYYAMLYGSGTLGAFELRMKDLPGSSISSIGSAYSLYISIHWLDSRLHIHTYICRV